MSVAAAGVETPASRTKAILAARARALARPARSEQAGLLVSLVLFDIGGRPHALEVGFVREVLRRPQLTFVPSATPALIGVTNVRGEMVTVADIGPLLGLPAPPVPGPVIVLEAGDSPLGVVVEAVHDLVDVPEDAVVAVPAADAPAGASERRLVVGMISGASLLSAAALVSDGRLSTTEARSGR